MVLSGVVSKRVAMVIEISPSKCELSSKYYHGISYRRRSHANRRRSAEAGSTAFKLPQELLAGTTVSVDVLSCF